MSYEEVLADLKRTARTAVLDCQHYALSSRTDAAFFSVLDGYLRAIELRLAELPEARRAEAMLGVVREMLQADAWLLRGRERRHARLRGVLPVMYAVFLCGVNIPHGRELRRAPIASALTNLPPGIQFLGQVGNSGNLLFSVDASSELSEEDLRLLIRTRLRVNLAVISADELKTLFEAARQQLGQRGHRDGTPTGPRVTA